LKDKIIHQSFPDIEKPFAGLFAVIGSFPYNTSSQIFFKILGWREEADCMFQKKGGTTGSSLRRTMAAL
jgi:16S rRNA (adenine1518-N6/adenine1519-N6)-dimethyltransferase